MDPELKLKFERLEARTKEREARAAAGGTRGGAEPGPTAVGASTGPERGAQAREVSGIGASSGVVPTGREGSIAPVADDQDEGFVKVERDELAVLVSRPHPRLP